MSEQTILPLNNWPGYKQRPYIISGPCSAETEEQVQQTVQRIAANKPDVQVLRAGIWKPRTRPNSFEGVGSIGLPWIVAAGKQVGLPICVEVANSQHVEQALAAGVDILWIGARSTVNPFQVQDIADALQGSNVPVMVKNPVNPDLELWIGAIERVANAGINRIAAIHRGFSTYEKTQYRNQPKWEIPIELKRRMPELPIINDPSHICGRRDLLQEVAQQAMDLDFDGLMIESHRNPDDAWSDAAQQLTPEALHQLIGKLVIRQPLSSTATEYPGLNELRANIDRIDAYILQLFSERMDIAEEIGEIKREHGITIYQPERWRQVVERSLKIGTSAGLSREFLMAVLQQIHKESIAHQTKVMNQAQKPKQRDS